jgi:arabinose-5-phosphate isomerase
MALGDALAVSAAEMKGFEQSDFARFHPHGSLGARLLKSVGEVMHPLPLPCCAETTLLREMISVMTGGRLGVVLVLRDEALVGIVTDGDLRRAFERGVDLNAVAGDLMTVEPLQIDAHDVVETARSLMLEEKVGVLPVVDNGQLCGVIQIYDC